MNENSIVYKHLSSTKGISAGGLLCEQNNDKLLQLIVVFIIN